MSPDYTIIGRRIRNLRLKNNMTQEKLADEIDISVAFMSRIERGTAHVNLKRLTQIAEILNVSPGYLLIGSNTRSKDYLKDDLSEILKKCNPQQQKLIFQISELVCKTNIGKENKG